MEDKLGNSFLSRDKILLAVKCYYSLALHLAVLKVKLHMVTPIFAHVDHPVLGEVKIVGQAVKMSRTPQRMRFATPELGAHTEEILKTLDYSDGDIQKLRDGGVI